MKTGGLEFAHVWIAAAIDAALGDWLSYWIGTKFKNLVARTWPFSHHPHLLLRGEAFIKNWGGLAIFTGLFSGQFSPCSIFGAFLSFSSVLSTWKPSGFSLQVNIDHGIG